MDKKTLEIEVDDFDWLCDVLEGCIQDIKSHHSYEWYSEETKAEYDDMEEHIQHLREVYDGSELDNA